MTTRGWKKLVGVGALGVGLGLAGLSLGCGGGGNEPARPTARPASSGTGGGVYYGGGGGNAGLNAGLGSGVLSTRMPTGGGGGGPIGDDLRRRRAAREAEMRRRLGPVRLTGDGLERWPLFEPAVRRVERETASETDPCERAMAAGEIMAEEVGHGGARIGERVRNALCPSLDEARVACADPAYVENHEDECRPLLNRGERLRRVATSDTPRPEAMESLLNPERAPAGAAARRLGTVTRPDEEPEVSVLPELDLPTRSSSGE